jgi:hypothetical protein
MTHPSATKPSYSPSFNAIEMAAGISSAPGTVNTSTLQPAASSAGMGPFQQLRGDVLVVARLHDQNVQWLVLNRPA